MDLWGPQSGAGLGSCSAISNVASVNCDSQRVLTPVAKCEWANGGSSSDGVGMCSITTSNPTHKAWLRTQCKFLRLR